MPGYRLFLFDGDRGGGQRKTRVVRLASENDDDAIRFADDHRRRQYAELWRHEDVLKVFEPD